MSNLEKYSKNRLVNKENVVNYLKYKLKIRRKKNGDVSRKGIELNYLKIAKRCNISYKQARTIIDKLIEERLIEKWTIYTGFKKCRCFYRLINQ